MTSIEAEHEVQRCATALFDSKPDWATFYREVLGVKGIVRRMYRTRESLDAFKRTDAYDVILLMLQKLRDNTDAKVNLEEEPISVITVRVPKSVHHALREEAYEQRTTMNQLCISKLLRMIEANAVESEAEEESGGEVDL